MIENMRGRSTETKYGRIPLWLYEAGVSLQAIATYGWLHGRYGHYDRVMPSYGTLAKELGVSRGSVITYVKALMAAGALRIEESGATDHRSNIYVIAFNEPFAVAAQVGAGQPADQSHGLVSPLTRTGQPADLAGQPTVHEEDVLKKTKKTLSPRVPKPRRQEPPAAPNDEREIPAAPHNYNPARQIHNDPAAAVAAAWTAARGGRRNPSRERKVRDSAAELLRASWTQADLTALAEHMARNYPTGSDLAVHEGHWQPPKAATSRPTLLLPDWCGHCNDGDDTAATDGGRRWIHHPDGTSARCHCHPNAPRAAAA